MDNLGLTSYNDFPRKALYNVYATNDIDSGPLLFSSLNDCFRSFFSLKGGSKGNDLVLGFFCKNQVNSHLQLKKN